MRSEKWYWAAKNLKEEMDQLRAALESLQTLCLLQTATLPENSLSAQLTRQILSNTQAAISLIKSVCLEDIAQATNANKTLKSSSNIKEWHPFQKGTGDLPDANKPVNSYTHLNIMFESQFPDIARVFTKLVDFCQQIKAICFYIGGVSNKTSEFLLGNKAVLFERIFSEKTAFEEFKNNLSRFNIYLEKFLRGFPTQLSYFAPTVKKLIEDYLSLFKDPRLITKKLPEIFNKSSEIAQAIQLLLLPDPLIVLDPLKNAIAVVSEQECNVRDYVDMQRNVEKNIIPPNRTLPWPSHRLKKSSPLRESISAAQLPSKIIVPEQNLFIADAALNIIDSFTEEKAKLSDIDSNNSKNDPLMTYQIRNFIQRISSILSDLDLIFEDLKTTIINCPLDSTDALQGLKDRLLEIETAVDSISNQVPFSNIDPKHPNFPQFDAIKQKVVLALTLLHKNPLYQEMAALSSTSDSEESTFSESSESEDKESDNFPLLDQKIKEAQTAFPQWTGQLGEAIKFLNTSYTIFIAIITNNSEDRENDEFSLFENLRELGDIIDGFPRNECINELLGLYEDLNNQIEEQTYIPFEGVDPQLDKPQKPHSLLPTVKAF